MTGALPRMLSLASAMERPGDAAATYEDRGMNDDEDRGMNDDEDRGMNVGVAATREEWWTA